MLLDGSILAKWFDSTKQHFLNICYILNLYDYSQHIFILYKRTLLVSSFFYRFLLTPHLFIAIIIIRKVIGNSMYTRKYDDDSKIFKSIRKCSIKCKCGHTVVINNKDKVLCTYCGHYVYNTRKQFREKMNELLKENVKKGEE